MKRYLLLLLFPVMTFAQHSISGKFTPAQDYTHAFLYKATPLATEFVARSPIDSTGSFMIELDSLAKPGIYKLVYALPPEKHNFNILFNAKEDINISYSEDSGLIFEISNENKLWASYTKSLEMVNSTISNFYSKGGEDKKAFKDIFKTLSETQNAYEENSRGMLVNRMILANRPYMPIEFEDISAYAENLKKDYLKNIDFNDELLQSSDLISDRVMTFIFGTSDKDSDEYYIGQLNTLVKHLEGIRLDYKLPLMLSVWEQFKYHGNHKVASYMIDNYLMDIAIATENHIVINNLKAYKMTALGMTASNFRIDLNNGEEVIKTSLHDLEGFENYLIVFWSSTCGHCLNELPQLKELMQNKDDIKVIAFGIEDDSVNWSSVIKEYPGFIHVLGLEKWDNPIVENYLVNATPSYFLLDKDKTIIAKPNDVTVLKGLLVK